MRWLAGAGVLVIGAAIAALASRKAARAAYVPPPGAIELHVPHAAGPIVLDGDTDDPGWLKGPARIPSFELADGAPARPHSEARLVWGDGQLYVALYAADEDIRATRTEPDAPLWLDDAFHLSFRDARIERTIDVSPLGTITDARREDGGRFDYAWSSGAHASREIDGTVNHPDDDDEEWAIELAIPLASLGLEGVRGERIQMAVRRCDVPHGGGRRVCAAWGETAPAVIVLD
jgi:hypothetical protein